MEILAFINGPNITPDGVLQIMYTGVAIDRASGLKAQWSSAFNVDINQSKATIQTNGLASIKATAADVTGLAVPGNVKVLVFGGN